MLRDSLTFQQNQNNNQKFSVEKHFCISNYFQIWNIHDRPVLKPMQLITYNEGKELGHNLATTYGLTSRNSAANLSTEYYPKESRKNRSDRLIDIVLHDNMQSSHDDRKTSKRERLSLVNDWQKTFAVHRISNFEFSAGT